MTNLVLISLLEPQQQLSQIEKSVTHLLVATKQLLETLTSWSRGRATEGEVSDVYVRLGYEFNIACRAFGAIGVDTADLGPVPDLLRTILEETLSQEATQQSLDRFLPRIRDIIINLLHGLKRKQQRLRQRTGRDGSGSTRQGSIGSVGDAAPDAPARVTSSRSAELRLEGAEGAADLPPRTTSIQGGRQSPSYAANRESNLNRNTTSSRGTLSDTSSSLSSNTMQNMPVVAPYPQEETMPSHPQEQPIPAQPPPQYTEENFPPPPPPPKQSDALAALQRGGELERRASRRFSAYQIQKHLGSNGIPMLPPAQNSPIPNRGRDVRESLNAVRARGSYMHGRQKSISRINTESPGRNVPRRISEEGGPVKEPPTINPPPEPLPDDSPTAKTPEDKLGPPIPAELDSGVSATLSGPVNEPVEAAGHLEQGSIRRHDRVPSRHGSRKAKSPTPQLEFVPEQSPQPGKELTLFLQYKSKVKKFVLADGYNDLSVARLQLAFIEKFAWNTHNNGVDLPEIYIQDPVSGVRHELEDLSDVKDRSVLVLNIEALDEVKKHFDDGMGGLRRVMEGIKSSIDDQSSALQRVSDRQQSAAKEIASIAAAPSLSSSRISTIMTPSEIKAPTASHTGNAVPLSPKNADAQLSEIQSLRRDLAVCRQMYSSFVSDVNASMAAVRNKAASVKAVAFNASTANLTGSTGRAYVDRGKKTLSDDSEKVVNRVDDLQDVVEDLRRDVVSRGVRPLPRQLETVEQDLKGAASELRRIKDFLKREKPLWTKIWEQELQVVCEERDLLTMQEELAADLEDDLEKARQTFELVEQATRQQQQDLAATNGDTRTVGSRNTSRNLQAVAIDQAVDPRKAKDGVLGEVRALNPNHEGRLEAIERAERARLRELESRNEGEFKKELGNFVEEGKLKKTGGAEEVERLRRVKDDRIRREVWERMNGPKPGSENVPPAEANGEAAEGAAPDPPPKNESESTEAEFVEAKGEQTPPVEEAAAA